jgi:hypothetical protein
VQPIAERRTGAKQPGMNGNRACAEQPRESLGVENARRREVEDPARLAQNGETVGVAHVVGMHGPEAEPLRSPDERDQLPAHERARKEGPRREQVGVYPTRPRA